MTFESDDTETAGCGSAIALKTHRRMMLRKRKYAERQLKQLEAISPSLIAQLWELQIKSEGSCDLTAHPSSR